MPFTNNPIVQKAQEIAIRGHHGQVNNHDGEPYILHVMRVARAVEKDGGEIMCIATAWLHDVLEDTVYTLTDLIEQDVPGTVVSAVEALTKRQGESNEDYYNRVKLNELASFVKLRDIHDNFGRNHLITDEATRLRMAKKYSLGISVLT